MDNIFTWNKFFFYISQQKEKEKEVTVQSMTAARALKREVRAAGLEPPPTCPDLGGQRGQQI